MFVPGRTTDAQMRHVLFYHCQVHFPCAASSSRRVHLETVRFDLSMMVLRRVLLHILWSPPLALAIGSNANCVSGCNWVMLMLFLFLEYQFESDTHECGLQAFVQLSQSGDS